MLPLREALHRLLGEQSFALVYASEGRVRVVKLLGGPQLASVPTTPPPLPAAPAAPAASLVALVTDHAPIAVEGRLADAVGAETASLAQLLDLGLHHEDPIVRAQTLRADVAALEGDPALRSAVLAELNRLDDGALGALLRGAAGGRAEEVARQILTQARRSELRVKASSLLQQLRNGGRTRLRAPRLTARTPTPEAFSLHPPSCQVVVGVYARRAVVIRSARGRSLVAAGVAVIRDTRGWDDARLLVVGDPAGRIDRRGVVAASAHPPARNSGRVRQRLAELPQNVPMLGGAPLRPPAARPGH